MVYEFYIISKLKGVKVSGEKKVLTEILFHETNSRKQALKVSTDIKFLCQILFTNFFKFFLLKKYLSEHFGVPRYF